MEIKTNLYNFSTSKNDFEKNLFEKMKNELMQNNLKKIVSSNPIILDITKEIDKANVKKYKKKLEELNAQANDLHAKLNFDVNQNNNNYILENFILKDITSNDMINNLNIHKSGNAQHNKNYMRNKDGVNERKEFLINELEVLANKENILLDEVIRYLFIIHS